MRTKSLGLALACVSALAATALGCGGGGGSVCDVDFESIAGTYSFTMTLGRTAYTNSCFENFSGGDPDPNMMTNCTWSEEADKETVTVELTIQDDGNIGDAKVTKIVDSNGQTETPTLGVKCEMLEGELCNAPVRCTFTGDKCEPYLPSDPNEWQWSCGCSAGGANDPASQVCQDCKAAYDKYMAEDTAYCQKSRDSEYLEFTLSVK